MANYKFHNAILAQAKTAVNGTYARTNFKYGTIN